jgi:hypothetical protein
MKSFRLTTSLLILACSFATASAQGKKAKVSVQVKEKACRTNQVSFPCPAGLQIKNDGKTGIFVAYSEADKFGVFAFAPDKTLSEADLSDETMKHALQNLYSTKLDDYRWKSSNDFYDGSAFSKYEVSKAAIVGFNKNQGHVIHLQYVRLSFNKKDIIAGLVYELASGSVAENTFNRWSGGGSGPASDGLQELIVKITGEKKNTETPGGPPPGAAPPPGAMAKSN